MSGARGGLGRMIAMGIALALTLLLLGAREASAGKYTVAQCGWHLGADADWADTSGGKFRPDAYCATPPAADPFDGVHMKSFTVGGASTVSGTRFSRWRWSAPAGTGITRVSATWWHALHDGLEQRIGAIGASGAFQPFAQAWSTDTILRDFVVGFSSPMVALEDRLLCARAESKWCSLEPGSWSGIRALTITLEDNTAPIAVVGGELTNAGWHRGPQTVGFSGSDVGGGLHYAETTLDGARIGLWQHYCTLAWIGGELRGTRMAPCELSGTGMAAIDSRSFSDGPHTLRHCEIDIAGNAACAPERTVLIDNNPPAHPLDLTLAGNDGWRRTNDFDLSWTNPNQGPASPIGGAIWRIDGPDGYRDDGHFVEARDIRALPNLRVPRAGGYTVTVRLRDQAGNEAPTATAKVALRLDDVAPTVAFAVPAGDGVPDAVRAEIVDAHSGPAGGTIRMRRLGTEEWSELPTKLERGDDPSRAALLARVPDDLPPGTYVFRASAVDGAGNEATSARRADGAEMAVRKVAEPNRAATSPGSRPARARTRIFARLRRGTRRAQNLTVPFGAPATLSGRLVDAEGAGLAGRRLRIVARPSRGALAKRRILTARTGRHGGFTLRIPIGPSRRLTVAFAGDSGSEPARRAPLILRSRAGIELHGGPTALATGGRLLLWGRVRSRGAAIPRRGKLVAIQYYETAARRWRPVLVTRSDHSGRFRASYRFRYVTGVASIRLRAVALAEERWPYVPGASEPVTVRVSG